MNERGEMSERLSALRRLCRRRRVGAILLTDPHSVRYFSGFTGEDSYLLVGGRWVRLLTDGRFGEQARIECPHIKAVVRKGRMIDAIRACLAGRRVRRVGIEGNHVTVTLAAEMERSLGKGRTKAFSGEVEALREVKTVGEVRAIARAVRAAEAGFRAVTARGAKGIVGRSEREVAAELDYRMRLAGADGPSFPTIVAAGPHAALPHYRPGSVRIRPSQPVLIDWGATVGGYCSDLTRVVFPGRIPPQIAGIYEVVFRAQAAGIAAVRPGATCGQADEAARDVIAQAGFGKAFVHGLGHGLGLEVHEGPRLGRGTGQLLAPGMVVTVEPGIYLPGVGGVRIEDDVVVTATGRRRLSRLPREIEAMVLR